MNHKFAIPTANGKVCPHFGHCDAFTIIEVEGSSVVNQYLADPPEHQPGTYPRFLHDLGVSVVIAGGMGVKAQNLFEQNGIDVVIGASENTPNDLVTWYLQGELKSGNNLCDH